MSVPILRAVIRPEEFPHSEASIERDKECAGGVRIQGPAPVLEHPIVINHLGHELIGGVPRWDQTPRNYSVQISGRWTEAAIGECITAGIPWIEAVAIVGEFLVEDGREVVDENPTRIAGGGRGSVWRWETTSGGDRKGTGGEEEEKLEGEDEEDEPCSGVGCNVNSEKVEGVFGRIGGFGGLFRKLRFYSW